MKIEKLDISGATIAHVQVGTTGHKGGDGGHGGRTYFEFRDSDANIQISTTHGGRGVKIELLGDSELDNFVAALEFALSRLKQQMGSA